MRSIPWNTFLSIPVYPVVFAEPHKGTVNQTSPSRYDDGDALKRGYCLIMDRIDVSSVRSFKGV